MAWLLAHGAKMAGSASGLTKTVSWDALKHAISFNRGCPGMLELLLKHGANVDSSIEDASTPGATALHGAAAKRDAKGVKVLLEYGADPIKKNAEGKRSMEVTRNKKVREVLENTRLRIKTARSILP
jgi:ankyrin repeat protein